MSKRDWSRSVLRPYSLLVAGLLAAALGTSPARARVQTNTGYTKTQAFNGALRFIRIDHGYRVTEKDVDSGYLLFEYKTGASDKITTGSVEVIEKEDGVAFVVQLSQMPEHHERYLADGLLAKLRSDYGDAPEKRPPSSNSKKGKSQEDKDKEDDSGAEKDKDKSEEGEKSKKTAPVEGERVPGYRIQ